MYSPKLPYYLNVPNVRSLRPTKHAMKLSKILRKPFGSHPKVARETSSATNVNTSIASPDTSLNNQQETNIYYTSDVTSSSSYPSSSTFHSVLAKLQRLHHHNSLASSSNSESASSIILPPFSVITTRLQLHIFLTTELASSIAFYCCYKNPDRHPSH